MNRPSFFILVCILAAASILIGIVFYGPTPVPTSPDGAQVEVQEGRVKVSNSRGEVDLKQGENAVALNRKTPYQKTDAATPTQTPAPRIVVESPIALQIQVTDDQDHALASAIITDGSTEARTNEQGVAAFTLSQATPGLSVQAPGHFRERVALVPNQTEYAVQLDRKMKITATVEDETGAAVTDAVVSAEHSDAIAKASGETFILEPLHPGAHQVEARHKELLGESKTVNAGDKVTLQLKSSATVIAHVSTARGEPVAGASLNLVAIQGGGFTFASKDTTNALGEASFENIRRGTYTIGIEHPWYRSYREEDFYVSMATEEINITLPDKTHSISGRVYDAESKQPLPNVPVICGIDHGQRSEFIKNKYNYVSPLEATRTAITDETGFYQFDELWSGTYIVFADKIDGYISGEQLKNENASGKTHKRATISSIDAENVDIYLEHPWIVSGTVYTPTGAPAPGETIEPSISIIESSGIRKHYDSMLTDNPVVTDSEGRYEIVGTGYLPDGGNANLYVSCHSDRYYYAIRRLEGIEPGKRYDNVDLHFEAWGIIEGYVQNTKGEPIENAEVQFFQLRHLPNSTNTTPEVLTEQTDEMGYYRLFVFSKNLLYPAAYADGYERFEAIEKNSALTVELNNEPVRYDFILEDGESDTIEGQVIDDEGNPVTDVSVRINIFLQDNTNYSVRWSIGRSWVSQTDENGRFAFDMGLMQKSWAKIINPAITNSGEYEDYVKFEIIIYGLKDYENYPTYDPEKPRETFTWGQKDILIVLKKKDVEEGEFSIHGQVVDEQSAPIPNYEIIAVPSIKPGDYYDGSPHYHWNPVYSSDGMFILDGLKRKQGPFRIIVRSSENKIKGTAPIIGEANQVVSGVVIVLDSGATIT
ncbi:carboxypeptidase-like regulatory domain-containing protein, partial [bacterium]|nr:carboxypeptidase-like regulatory domain-containing protein [bacterium]